MRRRAFIPEALGCLEGRALLSGVPGPAHLSGPQFGLGLVLIRGDFEQFALGNNLNLLRTQLAVRAATIPFHKVDGLGQQVNAILAQMEANIAAKVPGAIHTAYHDVVTGVRAEIIKHIEDGTVVVDK